MKKTRYQKMPPDVLLDLILSDKYLIDLDLGIVQSTITKKELYTFRNKRWGNHLFIRLYCGSYRKGISVSRVIWIKGSGCLIPEGWEIHHINENPLDNRFENLCCLHPIDHKKRHQAQEQENAPF